MGFARMQFWRERERPTLKFPKGNLSFTKKKVWLTFLIDNLLLALES